MVLMVALQPSKLTVRVRVPLDAPTNKGSIMRNIRDLPMEKDFGFIKIAGSKRKDKGLKEDVIHTGMGSGITSERVSI